MFTMDTDSYYQQIQFHQTLLEIGDELGSDEVNTLKFLCQDFVPQAHRERIEKGTELFTELEQKKLLGPDNTRFLEELLYHIQRADLLRKLGTGSEQVMQDLKMHGAQISAYRLLLYEICEDLDIREVESMKFMATATLPSARLSSVQGAASLIQMLEQSQQLTPGNVTVLRALLVQIRRQDLVNKVEAYQRKAEGSPAKYNMPAQLPPGRPPPPYCEQDPLHPSQSQNEVAMSEKLQQQLRVKDQGKLHDWQRRFAFQQAQRLPSAPLPPHGPLATQPNRNQPRAVAGQRHLTPRQHQGQLQQQHPLQGNIGNVPLPVLAQDATDSRMAMVAQEEDEMPCYAMRSRPRGICLIINNHEFHQVKSDPQSRKMSNREGSSVDRDNVQYIFRKLEFLVKVEENLTETEMTRTMTQYALNINHQKYDCFACCILSHGEMGTVYGSDGRQVKIGELTTPFKANVCETLKGKPKIFFIQACQGKSRQPGLPDIQKDSDQRPETVDMQETIPNEADFLMAYSTIPGYVSYRSKSTGSWFISKLCEMLDRYAGRHDLLSIMIKVNEEVSRANANIQDNLYKQSPAPMATLRKKIYFN